MPYFLLQLVVFHLCIKFFPESLSISTSPGLFIYPWWRDSTPPSQCLAHRDYGRNTAARHCVTAARACGGLSDPRRPSAGGPPSTLVHPRFFMSPPRFRLSATWCTAPRLSGTLGDRRPGTAIDFPHPS